VRAGGIPSRRVQQAFSFPGITGEAKHSMSNLSSTTDAITT